MAELELYLQEATVEIETLSFDLLNWWRFNSLIFPTLVMMEKTILMIQMTLIASESDFLKRGRILRNSQIRLKSETLEALVCGQDWISSAIKRVSMILMIRMTSLTKKEQF
jgi:hypothetical protein